ncbi:MAG: thioesterase [Lachnospiraceae bacterium]|nr:thioesterase [Lachnospiraceae bacterium]
MNKKIQLFCVPFAGGSEVSFKEMISLLDERIEAVPIEYPGRGRRKADAVYEKMDELILDVKRQIESARNKNIPFALMGYSMGCEIVFDLAQSVLEESPAYLFLAAREAIKYDTRGHDYCLLDKDEFARRIVELGGIDQRLTRDKRFLDIYMRHIYEDYKLLHDYVYKPEKGPIRQNTTVFYSEKDTPFAKVEEWKEVVTGTIDFYEFGDNHFFINQYAKEMADIISDKLLGCI